MGVVKIAYIIGGCCKRLAGNNRVFDRVITGHARSENVKSFQITKRRKRQ